MNRNLKFNTSLKEFCIGLNRKEIRDYFGENFIEETDHVYVNNLYYRIALDHMWEDKDMDVCTDVWIDFEKTDKEDKSRATFLGFPLNIKEANTIIAIVVDMADEEPRVRINDESVLRRLIEFADEKKELENDLRYAVKRLTQLPKFSVGSAAYIRKDNEIVTGTIDSIHMDKTEITYTYTVNSEKQTFTNSDIGKTVFETKEDAQYYNEI